MNNYTNFYNILITVQNGLLTNSKSTFDYSIESVIKEINYGINFYGSINKMEFHYYKDVFASNVLSNYTNELKLTKLKLLDNDLNMIKHKYRHNNKNQNYIYQISTDKLNHSLYKKETNHNKLFKII